MREFLRSVPLVLVVLLPLGACGSSPAPDANSGSSAPVRNLAYEQALNRWVNHPEEDLVNAWGVPNGSQRLTDGGQTFEYRRVDAQGKDLCTTLFTSDIYGMIRTWTYRGIDCRAPVLGDYGHS
jgi:hypothetical protein